MAREQKSSPRFYLLRDAAFSDQDAAQKLIDNDPEIVHARNSTGETALHYLAVEDESEAVQWLLARGADINTRNDLQGTPLIDAAGLGYARLCQFLLENGANIHAQDHTGTTAISAVSRSEAAENGDTDLLELLLGHIGGADINDFFDDIDADMLLRQGHPVVVARLGALGLKPRDEDEEEAPP